MALISYTLFVIVAEFNYTTDHVVVFFFENLPANSTYQQTWHDLTRFFWHIKIFRIPDFRLNLQIFLDIVILYTVVNDTDMILNFEEK